MEDFKLKAAIEFRISELEKENKELTSGHLIRTNHAIISELKELLRSC